MSDMQLLGLAILALMIAFTVISGLIIAIKLFYSFLISSRGLTKLVTIGALTFYVISLAFIAYLGKSKIERAEIFGPNIFNNIDITSETGPNKDFTQK